ncbi:MAG: SMC-Scp complex subunit ScpB [Gammaproteobacteria bacterium HGW-Gammaproteobacteria-3]|jgi:segregation and condensation protein B|nr:MAG: SMC-Scp complex subunit ScpB [Gammaproteobacteria bacterium HGW-Gammaproteobacteria-3]
MEIKRIVEGILFAAQKPLTARQVQQVFPELEQPPVQDIQSAIDAVAGDYADRAIELRQVASGYRFQVKSELAYWVARLFEEKPARYSRALLETLAIIAYRQPVTRGDIENIRGVAVSSNIIRTLLEREWIRIVAHKEVPGRPALYGTSKQFLDYFDLSSLQELPTLQEVQDLAVSVANNQQPMQVNSEPQETTEQQEFTQNATENTAQDTPETSG